MNFLSLAVLLAPLVSALAISSPPTRPQRALVDETSSPDREKVPGDNPAYFTSVKRKDQLFSIADFTVSPYPPIKNHRIFFYLSGETYIHADLPGLANATLEIHMKSIDAEDDGDTYFYKNTISDFKLFTVRDEEEYAYGGPLVLGPNEMVGDFFMFHFGHEYGVAVWYIEVVAKLPDERVLFAFGARVVYVY